jgi:prepilin-type N-terminal cleavage/methylation domain-containing protein
MKRRSFQPQTTSQQNRHAFTLIELMIAIVIILILLGLLIPAIGAVRLRAQQSQVRTEIANLEAAITAFKADFGIDPPSGINLYETSAGWAGDPRSRGIIRQMWPGFDFSLSRDIDRDMAYTTPPITLNSGECLTFFLGGIWDTTNKTPNGFSKDPADPFKVATAGTNRQGPYFEFDNNRFTDIDGDKAPEYLDSFPSQQLPYLYFSSYNGRGYRSSELPNLPAKGLVVTSVYRQGDPTGSPGVPYKPKSYQIVSPGADFQFGPGGNYDPNKNFPVSPVDRTVESDNVANFVNGSLK